MVNSRNDGSDAEYKLTNFIYFLQTQNCKKKNSREYSGCRWHTSIGLKAMPFKAEIIWSTRILPHLIFFLPFHILTTRVFVCISLVEYFCFLRSVFSLYLVSMLWFRFDRKSAWTPFPFFIVPFHRIESGGTGNGRFVRQNRQWYKFNVQNIKWSTWTGNRVLVQR